MRRLIASEFMTLDGVMEAPGGEKSLGDLGGWVFRHGAPEVRKIKQAELFESGALLLGRVTYQIFAAVWPTRTDADGHADRINGMPKFVASRTLKAAKWNNTRLIKGNVAEEVSRLKEQPGQDILVIGSAGLVHTLMQYDLIDEYRIMLFPVVLGRGKHLFQDETAMKALELVSMDRLGSGIAILTYRRAGSPAARSAA